VAVSSGSRPTWSELRLSGAAATGNHFATKKSQTKQNRAIRAAGVSNNGGEVPEDDDEVLTTSNRARRLGVGDLQDAAKSSRATLTSSLPVDAREASVRHLEADEEVLVKQALSPHLGPNVELYQVIWYQSDVTGDAIVRGVCAQQSAWCVSKTKANTTDETPDTHHRNRVAFSLHAGSIQVRCFACDGALSGHRFPFETTTTQRQLLGVVSMADAGAPAISGPSARVASGVDSGGVSTQSIDGSVSVSPPAENRQQNTLQFIRKAFHTLSLSQRMWRSNWIDLFVQDCGSDWPRQPFPLHSQPQRCHTSKDPN
jgi:hypothetical protein